MHSPKEHDLETFKNTFLVKEINASQIESLITYIIALDAKGINLEHQIISQGYFSSKTMLDVLAEVQVTEYPNISLKHAIVQYLVDDEKIFIAQKIDWLCNIANFEAFSEPHNDKERTSLSALFYKKSKLVTPSRHREGDAICFVYKELNAIINGKDNFSQLSMQWTSIVANEFFHVRFINKTSLKTLLYLLRNGFEVVKDDNLINQWFKPIFLAFLKSYKDMQIDASELLGYIADYRDGFFISNMDDGNNGVGNNLLDLCVEIYNHVLFQNACVHLREDYQKILGNFEVYHDFRANLIYKVAENFAFSIDKIEKLLGDPSIKEIFMILANKQYSENPRIEALCRRYLEINHDKIWELETVCSYILQILENQNQKISLSDIIHSLQISKENKMLLCKPALKQLKLNITRNAIKLDVKINQLIQATNLFDTFGGKSNDGMVSVFLAIAFDVIIKGIKEDSTYTLENLENCYKNICVKIFSYITIHATQRDLTTFVKDNVEPKIQELIFAIIQNNRHALSDFILTNSKIMIHGRLFNKFLIDDRALRRLLKKAFTCCVQSNNTHVLDRLFQHKDFVLENDDYNQLRLTLASDTKLQIQPKTIHCIFDNPNIYNAKSIEDWIIWANLLSHRENRTTVRDILIQKNVSNMGAFIYWLFFMTGNTDFNADIVFLTMGILKELYKPNELAEIFISSYHNEKGIVDNPPNGSLLKRVSPKIFEVLIQNELLTDGNCQAFLASLRLTVSDSGKDARAKLTLIVELFALLRDYNLLTDKNRNALVHSKDPDSFCNTMIAIKKAGILTETVCDLLQNFSNEELNNIADGMKQLSTHQLITPELVDVLIANPKQALKYAEHVVYMNQNPQLNQFFKPNRVNNTNDVVLANEDEKKVGSSMSGGS